MSLLLLTLASDPLRPPRVLDALASASALRGGRGSSTELAPPDTVVVLDEAFYRSRSLAPNPRAEV